MLALTLRLVLSLAAVVGLMLLLARLARRRMHGGPGTTVEVLHKQQLGRGSGVAVVRIGERLLVLGSTEHQVSLLTEMSADELLDGLPEELLDEPVPAAAEPAAPVPVVETAPAVEPAAVVEPAAAQRISTDSISVPPPSPGRPRQVRLVTDGPAAALVDEGPVDLMPPPDLAELPELPELLDLPELPAEPAAPGRRRTPRTAPRNGGALDGSLLSPDTWRQALAAVTGRAS